MQKNYPLPDVTETANVVSATGATGLKPTFTDCEFTNANYTDINKYPHQEETLVNVSKNK